MFFWNSVFLSYIKLCEKIKIKSNDNILASPFWYNPMITSTTLFFQIGLKTVGDIVDNNGCVLAQQEIQRAFNIQRINCLDYYCLKIVIDKFIKEHKIGDSFNFL